MDATLSTARASGGDWAGRNAAAGLRVELTTPLPEQLDVGRGNAIFVEGRCSHPGRGIATLAVAVGGSDHPVMAHGMPLPRTLTPGDCWWAVVPFGAVAEPTVVSLALKAGLEGGGEATVPLGSVRLLPGSHRRAAQPSEGLVAICMATFNPPRELFARQVESIREQTHADWVCVISDDASGEARFAEMLEVIGDDPRFRVERSEQRLGFYRNFERALALAPAEAQYVALADQDDRWYPEKLETLIAELSPDSKLAYSDMRIVTEGGEVVGESYWGLGEAYWERRRNNYEDFASMLIANTVTGAASILRHELLDWALPFPPDVGKPYHDHWVGLVAMALGPIDYIDRPLHDYVQHSDAELGHERANALRKQGRLATIREKVSRLRAQRFHPGWRALYFNPFMKTVLFSNVLALRCGDRMSPQVQRVARRFSGDLSPWSTAWLAARWLRPFLGATETMGWERSMVRAMLWRLLASPRARLVGRRPAPEPEARGARPGPGARRRGREWLTPILVDYFSRDGSTLMMRLLGSSPQIAVGGDYPYEDRYFTYLWRWAMLLGKRNWPADQWRRAHVNSLHQQGWEPPFMGPPPWRQRDLFNDSPTDPLSRRAFELVWGEFSQRAAGRTRARHGSSDRVHYYAEKHLRTGRLNLPTLPTLRVIATLRDPRDTFLSIAAFDEKRGSYGFGRRDGESVEEYRDRLIDWQRARLQWIVSCEQDEGVRVVRYDELVLDLESVAAELGEWLGVRFRPEAVLADAEMREKHVTARAPEDSVGRWRREMDAADVEAFNAALEPELQALGFEL